MNLIKHGYRLISLPSQWWRNVSKGRVRLCLASDEIDTIALIPFDLLEWDDRCPSKKFFDLSIEIGPVSTDVRNGIGHRWCCSSSRRLMRKKEDQHSHANDENAAERDTCPQVLRTRIRRKRTHRCWSASIERNGEERCEEIQSEVALEEDWGATSNWRIIKCWIFSILDELHAKLVYAEALLIRALLTFIQDQGLFSFISGALKIKECHDLFA